MKDINAVADIPTIVKHTNSVLDLRPMLFRVAMGYLRNYERADDITQATMIELYKYAGEPENIEAYAVAALKRNITRSYGRRDTNTVFLEDIPNYADVIADTDDAEFNLFHIFPPFFNFATNFFLFYSQQYGSNFYLPPATHQRDQQNRAAVPEWSLFQ